ncbi:uncharacterized protein L3040_004074 [Drepanopeziza brunnea f. sp. 'multigermtubi']|uniref:Uncharacterized protein n=1 Tax=Marssonina brunnea f. sp. multigermtubi (strain MB_m1) TaxID=1072389 RepID=K1XJF1_MARBU|nr:uncharacterized protein MBM_09310 [Drepanopeziza brunnea f. sp. 'multigermtubi' MB_m1]EKD12554.1 hypothetical protein MBM_09310 [Drepanopeziza brunnea f. sp. 'multigermtubi' MB_m1]KAJ5042675.1 hypothetical protein L3040_004074 [Drepanopeziza brunnea f. sp. 'multigermtubi']
MCSEVVVVYACGCQELKELKMCEWAIMPSIQNKAHPFPGLFMPTVNHIMERFYCRECAEEKIKKAKKAAPKFAIPPPQLEAGTGSPKTVFQKRKNFADA